MIRRALINQVARNLLALSPSQHATLAEGRLRICKSLFQSNVVKLVTDHQGFALYFSRAPWPWCRDCFCAGAQGPCQADTPFRRHIAFTHTRSVFCTTT